MKELTKSYLYKKYVVEKNSMPEIAKDSGYSYSNIRYYLKKYGIPIRSRKEALNTDRAKKKISKIALDNGAGTYKRTEEIRTKASEIKKLQSKKNAKGLSLKPNGYFEITKGEFKGRMLHDVIMEMFLGRRLRKNECVHHIDRDKTNCSIDNLALLTKKGHIRLHRFEDKLEGKKRTRNKKGQFK